MLQHFIEFLADTCLLLPSSCPQIICKTDRKTNKNQNQNKLGKQKLFPGHYVLTLPSSLPLTEVQRRTWYLASAPVLHTNNIVRSSQQSFQMEELILNSSQCEILIARKSFRVSMSPSGLGTDRGIAFAELELLQQPQFDITSRPRIQKYGSTWAKVIKIYGCLDKPSSITQQAWLTLLCVIKMAGYYLRYS